MPGGKLGVNIFVLITGYYMSQKTAKVGSKVLKNWLLVLLYSWFIAAASFIILRPETSMKSLLKAIFPIVFEEYWFMTAFVGVLILSPWVNKLIASVNNRDMFKGLIVLFVMQSFIPTFTGTETWLSNLSFFTFLYITGAYINRSAIAEKVSKRILLFMFGGSIIAMWGISMILWVEAKSFPILSNYINYFSVSVESVFIYFSACSIFLFAIKQRRFSNTLINSVATYIVGGYLFQSHDFVSGGIWSFVNSKLDFESVWCLTAAAFIYIVIIAIGSGICYLITGVCDAFIKSKTGTRICSYLDGLLEVT